MADEVASLKVSITGDASDLQATIRQVERELSNLEKKTRAKSSKTKTTDTSAAEAKAKKTNTSAQKENSRSINDNTQSRNKNDAGMEKNAKSIKKNTQLQKENAGQHKKTAVDLEKTGRKWKDAGDAVNTIARPVQIAASALAAGGVAAAKFAIDFEDNFANVKKTVDGTPEQLEAVRKGIIDLSTSTPQGTAELTELAATAGQLGIKTDNILNFTEIMAQMGTATNLYGEEGAATLAKFANITQMSQDKFKNLGSAIVDLGNNFATTESDIARMSMRIASAGSTVDMTEADILGLATALSSTGMEAEAGGSAISRQILDIQAAVSDGGDALEDYAKAAGMSAKDFKKSWETDATETLLTFFDALSQSKDLSGTLADLGIDEIRQRDAVMRLANAHELLRDAISTGNTAFEEGTALQTEFDAKVQTTASQIAIAKNNLVEAGRSMGEAFLPMIADASGGVKEFAQRIAGLDESQKKKIVDMGAAIIGLGAGSFALGKTVTGVGNLVETVGKIKTTLPWVSKIGPAITAGITSPAGIAALAVAGIGIAGAAAYKTWYKSQYQWSDGLAESVQRVQQQAESVKKLTDMKREISELKLVISSDQSSKEEIERAKSRLKEIQDILKKNYNLDVTCDTTQLDEALAKLSKLERNDLVRDSTKFKTELANKKQSFDSAPIKIAENNERKENAGKLVSAYSDLNAEIMDLNRNFNDGKITQDEFFRGATESLQKAKSSGIKDIKDFQYGLIDAIDSESKAIIVMNEAGLQMQAANDDVQGFQKKIDDLNTSQGEYIKTAEDYANAYVRVLQSDVMNKDTENIAKDIEEVGYAVQKASLNASDYAKKVSLAQNGVQSLNEAWAEGGEKLDNVVTNYIQAGQKFGIANKDISIGAALIKNGFTSIGEAVDAGKLDVVTQQANDLAHSMGLIPQDVNIRITESGDVEYFKQVETTVEGLDGKECQVAVKVNSGDAEQKVYTVGELVDRFGTKKAVALLQADDNATVTINGASYKLADYDGETGTATLTAEDGATATIDLITGEIHTYSELKGEAALTVAGKTDGIDEVDHANQSADQMEDKQALLEAKGQFPGEEKIATALDYQNQLQDVTVTYTVHYESSGSPAPAPGSVPNAKGTRNFPGGLAVINDERGTSDPRELVEHKGKHYLFEGRDIVLPLDEGDRVYTAAQTKKMLNGLPHYAKGKKTKKDTSWEDAKKTWEHQQKTALVPLTAEDTLRWIEQMRKKFAKNTEAMMELDEKFVTATRDNWRETLDAMSYAQDMGWVSQEEYYQQLMEYRDENFAPGTEEYKQASLELHEYSKQIVEDANDVSESWIGARNALNDWGDKGDSIGAAYSRIADRNREALMDGRISQGEYNDTMLDSAKQLLDGRLEYSENWIAHEKEYNSMSIEDERAARLRMRDYVYEFFDGITEKTDEMRAYEIQVKQELEDAWKDLSRAEFDAWDKSAELYRRQSETYGWDWLNPGDTEEDYYKRRLEKLEEYHNQGKIGWEEYCQAVAEDQMNLFKAQEATLDDMLGEMSQKISDQKEEFSKQEQALRTSWEVEDRTADKADVERQLANYEGAVTKEGKQKYKELQEELKQLSRDEELFNLQEKNSAVIEEMEAEMKAAEENKKALLEGIRTANQSVSAYCKSLEQSTGGIEKKMDEIMGKLDNMGNTIDKSVHVAVTNHNSVYDRTAAELYGTGHNVVGRYQ